MILNGRTIWSPKMMKTTITNSRLYELDNLSCFEIIFFPWWRVAPSFPWWKEAKIKTAPGWAKAVCCRLNGNKLASLKQISVLTASISQLFNAPPAEVGSFFAARLRHRPFTPTWTAQRIHKRGGYLIWPQRRGRKENQEGSRRSGKLFERSEFFPRGWEYGF